MNKKVLLILVLMTSFILFGCSSKEKEHEIVCKKDLNYSDNNITWVNEVSIKYDNNDDIINTTVKEFITVDSSISEESKEAFRTGVEKECTSEIGRKFDSCNIEKGEDRFVITFNTKKLDVFNSVITTSEDQTLDTNGNKSTVKDYLIKKGYACEEVK